MECKSTTTLNILYRIDACVRVYFEFHIDVLCRTRIIDTCECVCVERECLSGCVSEWNMNDTKSQFSYKVWHILVDNLSPIPRNSVNFYFPVYKSNDKLNIWIKLNQQNKLIVIFCKTYSQHKFIDDFFFFFSCKPFNSRWSSEEKQKRQISV